MQNPLKPTPSPERNQDVISQLTARVAEAEAATDAAQAEYEQCALEVAEGGSPEAAKRSKAELNDRRNMLADAKAALAAAEKRQAEAVDAAKAKQHAEGIKQIRAAADTLIATGKKLYKTAPSFVAVHNDYIDAAAAFADALNLVSSDLRNKQMTRLSREFRESRVRMHLKTLGIESMYRPPLLGMFYRDFLEELTNDTREIADQACR